MNVDTGLPSTRKGLSSSFLFAGSRFELQAFEDAAHNFVSVILDCPRATPEFRGTLAAESENMSYGVRCGMTFNSLIDGLGLSSRERLYPVCEDRVVKKAATIWHAALQILDEKYGDRLGVMPPLRPGPRSYLRVFDGGMA